MENRKLKIANGASEKSNAVKNVEVSFEDFAKRAANFPVSPKDRSYILCGHVPGGVRGSKNGKPVQKTDVMMLDFDGDGDSEVTFFDFVDSLELAIGFQFVAYTTRSYNGNNVRFRAILPFANELDADLHRAAVGYIADRLPENIKGFLDGCSYSSEQPVFLPCVAAEGNPHHVEVVTGEWFDPAALDLASDGRDVLDDDDDLMALITAAPLDLSESEIDSYLAALDPNTMTYGLDDGSYGWGNVMAALHHQYVGSAEGKEKFLQWSSRNAEKHNARVVSAKWDSFCSNPRGKKPLTFQSVIAKVRDLGGLAAPKVVGGELVISDAFDDLLVEASNVESLAEHKLFVAKIAAMPDTLLGKSDRSMLASELLGTEWIKEKGKGITLADIKSELAFKKGDKRNASVDLPEWATDWCYIEQSNKFHLIGSQYEINKEAFDARFNRMPECQNIDMNASALMLYKCALPTYADTLYVPGEPIVFEQDGQMYVNLFDLRGMVKPKKPDAQGLETIRKIMRHFELLIGDEDELRILIDWLAWLYQNPGKRMTWAVFLQGAEGIGKSLIQVMMAKLMGRNVRVLEASNLSGRFTGWAHGATLIVVEEVRVAGESKYVVEDRMKPLIANDVIQIEEKGRDHREVPNYANYLLLSNHKDALPLQSGNRRYAVIFSDLQTEDDLLSALGGRDEAADYFEDLFDSVARDIDAVAHWLSTWEVSPSFRHKGRAPKTKSFVEACSLSENHRQSYLEDMILKHACLVVGPELVDTMQLAELMRGAGDEEIKTQAISKGMLELGYTRAKSRVFISKVGRRTSVWYKAKVMGEERASQIVKQYYEKQPASESDDGFEDFPF